MPLDFQQIRDQVKRFGEGATQRERSRQEQFEQAHRLFEQSAQDMAQIREKVLRAARDYDISLRCAVPISEAFNARRPLPALPSRAALLAADGSQIYLDRHAEVDYCVVNVGAIQMQFPSEQPPRTFIRSRLMVAEELYSVNGTITDAHLALLRDVDERKLLAELAQAAGGPVFTLTDGPIELWGAKEAGESGAEFARYLQEHIRALQTLQESGAYSAGYVDKPGANLVVRALEVYQAKETDLANLRQYHPFPMVTDKELYAHLLMPDERSAVFGLQSQSARQYREQLGLHFFYMNVGRVNKPWIVRVETPAWVVQDQAALDHLHALVVQQCQLLGSRPYPYLLHRAHETALVSMQEKEQVTLMLISELRQQGIAPGDKSYKQSAKDSGPRSSFHL